MGDPDPSAAAAPESAESPDLEALFAAALELAGKERAVFLERSCRGEEELRRELEELLEAHDRSAGFFEQLGSDIAAAAPLELESAVKPTLRIDRYRALEVLGRGGMGAVYRAQRVDGAFDQQVALKLLHLDMDSPHLRARFLAERQLLAGLEHPHIARLLDGGVSEEGRPYFVMELVDGRPITDHCREEALSVEQILRLMLRVIGAVAYLHRHLVVHRDLKPGNVLVSRDGEPRLLDFGIAKLLAEGTGEDGLTRTGQAVLTPEYAAPEQLDGGAITTATDVYTLGLVLYELLTGCRPHDRRSRNPDTASRELPARPSLVLKAGNGGSREEAKPAARLPWRRVAGDLDQICLTALAPEPERRYASAAELGQDLERHLEGLPVRARPGTLGYRLERFARRHRRGVAAAAVGLAVLGAVLVRERQLRAEADAARIEANLEASKAVAISDFLGGLLSSVQPRRAQGRELTVAEVLDEAVERLEGDHELQAQPAVEASVRLTIGSTYTALGEIAKGRPHLERALELRERGAHSELEVLEALAAIARSGANEQEAVWAEPMFERVLEGRTRLLGEEHPLTLEARNQLATVLWLQGRLDEVAALDRRTLEIRRRLLGPEHADTLRSINNLAATLHSRARYAEAAELFAEALELERRQLGPDHPDTLMLGNNTASCLIELGRYAEAEALLREVLAARLRVLGPEHEETAMTMHNLAHTRAYLGDLDEAAELMERTVAAREQQGHVPSRLLGSRLILADVYRDQGRLGEAERLYFEVLEEARSPGPSASERVAAKARAGLGALRLRQGRPDDAEALVQEALEAQQGLESGHPEHVQSTILLTRVRLAQGRYREALALGERAAEAAGSWLGTEHPQALDAAMEQARALRALNRPQEALALLEKVQRTRAVVLGEQHPDTLGAAALAESLRR